MRPLTALLFIIAPYHLQCSASDDQGPDTGREAGVELDASDGTPPGRDSGTEPASDPRGGDAGQVSVETEVTSSPSSSSQRSDETLPSSTESSDATESTETSGTNETSSERSSASSIFSTSGSSAELPSSETTWGATGTETSSAPSPTSAGGGGLSSSDSSSLPADSSQATDTSSELEGTTSTKDSGSSSAESTSSPDGGGSEVTTGGETELECPEGRRATEPDAGASDPSDPLYEDLVLLLKMNTGTSHGVSLFCDASGLGNHGRGFGTAATLSNGKFGVAAAFDGGGWIAVDDHPSLHPTDAFTVSAWVRLSSLTEGKAPGIVAKRRGYTVESSYALFLFEENRAFVDVDFETDRFASQQIFEVGPWYHLTVVFDGTLTESERVKLYVDGQLDRVASETSAMLPANDAPLEIGRLINGGDYLHGAVDEVALWTRALTPEEVNALPTWDL